MGRRISRIATPVSIFFRIGKHIVCISVPVRAQAPFIEEARSHGGALYRTAVRAVQRREPRGVAEAVARMTDRWQRYANPRFLQGVDTLCLDPNAGAVELEDVNRFLAPRTGFKAKAVSGRSGVPLFRFVAEARVSDHDHHPRRGAARLPPRAGHFPRHRRSRTDAHGSAFADALVRFGDAYTAVEMVRSSRRSGRAGAADGEHHEGDGALLLVHGRVPG